MGSCFLISGPLLAGFGDPLVAQGLQQLPFSAPRSPKKCETRNRSKHLDPARANRKEMKGVIVGVILAQTGPSSIP